MPHAHHFLGRLDRVTREQTEYALALYRDHEAVRYVLDRVSLPPGAERAALALGEANRGPFVVVTRDGHFVTCLGEGMSPGALPIVPRGQLDALLAKVADKRALKELAQRELRPHEEEGNLFERIIARGSRLTREDFLAVKSFENMLGYSPYYVMLDFSGEVLRERPGAQNVRTVHKGIAKAVEKHDRLTWAVAHLCLLSGAGERKDLDQLLELGPTHNITPTYTCAVHMGHTFSLRAAWLAGRLGKPALARYREVFETSDDWIAVFDAALGIGAIGLRHASALGDALRILRAGPAHASVDDAASIARAAYGVWVADAVEGAEARLADALKVGRELCVVLSSELPEGHPLRYASQGDVPEPLARSALLSLDLDMNDVQTQQTTILCLPIAARAAPEDFYFPRDVTRAWMGAWTPEETVERLSRFNAYKLNRKPVRVAPAPGRNDPCTCGSGKKWKRCCGASA